MHPRLSQVASTSAPAFGPSEGLTDGSHHFRRRPLSQRTLQRNSNDRRIAAHLRDGSQTRAVAIPWGEGSQEQELFGGGKWGDWTYEEQQADTIEEAVERPTLQMGRRQKPLKINRDLLLVRVRDMWGPQPNNDQSRMLLLCSLKAKLWSDTQMSFFQAQHRAKVLRQLAFRAPNVADKLRHQREAEAAIRR